MQEIVKKRQKKIPPLLRIALAIFAVLCIGGFFLLSRPAPPKVPSAPPKFAIWQADKDQIASVTLFPTGGSPYTLVKDGSTYALKDNPDTPINQTLADEIVSGLSSISAMAIAKEQVQDAEKKDFGVTSSSVRMEIQAADGRKAVFTVGDLLPGDVLSWFLYDEARRIVYLTDVNYRELCNVTQKEIHPVPRINFTPDLVTGISIEGKTTFGLRQEKGIWSVSAPFFYPADTGKAKELTQMIGKMRLAVYEGRAEALDLSGFGLDVPRADIRISFAPSVITRLNEHNDVVSTTDVPAHEERFLIGNPISSVGFYCLYDGVVYKATDTSMGFWLKIIPEDYTLKTPVNFQPAILKELSVVQGDIELQYTITLSEQVLPNNRFATAEDGTTLYDMHVALNGKEINTDAFVGDYMELTKLRVSSFTEDFSTENKTPFLSLMVKHENGERKIDFYDADALYAAVSVDGVILHLVEKQALKSFDLLSLR